MSLTDRDTNLLDQILNGEYGTAHDFIARTGGKVPATSKRYVIIENTPGYLPEDDDLAEFDTFAEALAYLVVYNNELAETTEYRVEPIVDGSFDYYDNEKTNDLGRHVEIIDREDD